MGKLLENWILQGEHQQQDFKYAITDSRKIAKSLVAFANTDGGRLLIGVKDNGAIVGVADEEEVYMIEAAAQMYCKPPVEYTVHTHRTRTNKTVLEIHIEKSTERPHLAQDNSKKWWAYLRKDDENILASKVQLEVWKKEKGSKGTLIRYSKAQETILNYLKENEPCTLSEIAKKNKLHYKKAEYLIVQLIVAKVVRIDAVGGKASFYLCETINEEDSRCS